MASGYLLGLDVGSSAIKASLLDAESGTLITSATSPETEMKIDAPHPDWAEQSPDLWWKHVQQAVKLIGASHPDELRSVEAIGISYQMHGLVIVDKKGEVLRPAIIWCDSRAVSYGEEAFMELGDTCLTRVLNSPGNFTAAKLAWVKENEPAVYSRIDKMMLPGDYIGYRLTGTISTTPSGVSEGILWDAREDRIADFLLDHFGFSRDFIPEVNPTFSVHGKVTAEVAGELGLREGTPVAYRAGDQPNNAFSLNVLKSGELAATAGTSGVVYGVVDKPVYDVKSRVNTFVHVNHVPEDNRYGVLLCLNGTGILNRWLKQILKAPEGGSLSYEAMNQLAQAIPIGSQGIRIMPFGNGAERMLQNANPGGSVHGLNFNVHDIGHILRAGQEGIVFGLNFGLDIMREMNMQINTVKAGYANMFLSPLFREAFATVTGATVELYNTDGAQGAARGAGVGAGVYSDFDAAFKGLEHKETVKPNRELQAEYGKAYASWQEICLKSIR
jgi:xylulokinase